MKVEIMSEKPNSLLHRREIDVVISDYTSTPNRKDVVAAVSAQLGADEALVSIDKIKQGYGQHETRCYVKVYETEDFKNRYELKYKVERLKEKKTAEKPAEAPAAPAEAKEEKTEEKKVESKESKPEEKPAEESKEGE